VANLTIKHDRRVADVETVYDPVTGIFNSLFSTATPLFQDIDDGTGLPHLKRPSGNPFVVKDIFTDFKRHDLGANFYERNWDGTTQTQFLTRPLWGVGSTAPYGHDGRSITLNDVILRRGGRRSPHATVTRRWIVLTGLRCGRSSTHLTFSGRHCVESRSGTRPKPVSHNSVGSIKLRCYSTIQLIR
jgi:hypothetical protein